MTPNLSEKILENKSDYSLNFLKKPEGDFKAKMLEHIRVTYPHLLDEEDIAMLAAGDPNSLEVLSNKITVALRNSHSSTPMDL